MPGFQILVRCVDVSVVAAKHLVYVFERPALRLGQHSCGKQRPGEIDGSQDREAASVAKLHHQRPVHVRARGSGRQPDETADGCGDTADRLRKQLCVEDTGHARPAERINRHEDCHADQWQASSRRHPTVVVSLQHQRWRRRVCQRHVTGNRWRHKHGGQRRQHRRLQWQQSFTSYTCRMVNPLTNWRPCISYTDYWITSADWLRSRVPLDTAGHFGDKSFQAINFTGTDNQSHKKPRENIHTNTTKIKWLLLRENIHIHRVS